LNPQHTSHPPRVIGLISNPHSRRNRAALGKVEAIVANQPHIHHCVTRAAADISAALQDFAARGVNVLAINGGDGTTAQVFTELLLQVPFEQLPAIILLPGGTTNMNVGDVGLRGGLVTAVQRLVDWSNAASDYAEHLIRPILKVSGAADSQPLCGMFFGTGTIINGIEYCKEHVHTLGIRDELGPGLVMLRTFWGLARREPRFSDPTPTRITLGPRAEDSDRPVVQLVISSLQRLFLGLYPFWGDEPGALRCTWIEKPARHLLRAFPALVRGRPNRHLCADHGYFSHNADEIRLLMDGIFTLDGEMYQARRERGPLVIGKGGTLEFLRIPTT
jgi:hypothetical protein